jgi:signal transduction histidine kinase/ActR/RegA family two-component response regulator
MQTNTAITVEQAHFLHKTLLPAAASTSVFGVITVSVFWRLADAASLLICLAVFLATGMIQWFLWRRYRDPQLRVAHAGKVSRLAAATTVATGVSWATAIHFIFPANLYPQDLIYFCAALAGGISAVFTVGIYYPAFMAGFMPLALTALWVTATQDTVFKPLLLSIVASTLLLSYLAWHFNRLLIDSLGLRFENVDLVAQLTEQAAELTQQRELAVQGALAKSRFLAAASHDLRQPVHALNLFLGALAGHPLPEASRTVLVSLRQCAGTIDEMFRQLLDISRLDANVVHPNLTSFPIGPLLGRIQMEYTPQAKARGLNFRVAACSAWVHTDAFFLERILRNLVENALRHTQRGSVLVGCRHSPVGLRLAVYDTGIGIAPDQQQRIFEEFYQVGNPVHDRAQGLGLGLAIVQRLAWVLHSKVTLVSELNRGSVFGLELVRVPAIGFALPTQSATKPIQQGDLRGLYVVVVDDEPAILDAMRLLLQQWGCSVLAVTSAREAIDQLNVNGCIPDLLISDYHLHDGETGIDVIDALGVEFNTIIPALLITGDTSPEQLVRTQRSGLTVLHKPLSDDELRAALVELIAAPIAL